MITEVVDQRASCIGIVEPFVQQIQQYLVRITDGTGRNWKPVPRFFAECWTVRRLSHAVLLSFDCVTRLSSPCHYCLLLVPVLDCPAGVRSVLCPSTISTAVFCLGTAVLPLRPTFLAQCGTEARPQCRPIGPIVSQTATLLARSERQRACRRTNLPHVSLRHETPTLLCCRLSTARFEHRLSSFRHGTVSLARLEALCSQWPTNEKAMAARPRDQRF